ncbi:MAG: hypothetical protein ACQES8_03510 [Thermodesulfobacteriota bacterium]
MKTIRMQMVTRGHPGVDMSGSCGKQKKRTLGDPSHRGRQIVVLSSAGPGV